MKSESVVLAAEAYAVRCIEFGRPKFETAELLELKAWFYAGARWHAAHPTANLDDPLSAATAEADPPAPTGRASA